MTATSWTRELAMELLIDPGNAPVHSSLSLVDALDEMFEWVADPREYVSQHEQAWRSAASDLRAAAAESGPRLSLDPPMVGV